VEVTTKHSYAIDYRYVWECVGCGQEYRRHSKSIDPAKHRCGTCREALVQVRPVPRGVGAGGEYQAFVRENFTRVKGEVGGAGNAVVMEEIGRRYREEKARKAEAGSVELIDRLARELDAIVLD
jgi:hypothetical protein